MSAATLGKYIKTAKTPQKVTLIVRKVTHSGEKFETEYEMNPASFRLEDHEFHVPVLDEETLCAPERFLVIHGRTLEKP